MQVITYLLFFMIFTSCSKPYSSIMRSPEPKKVETNSSALEIDHNVNIENGLISTDFSDINLGNVAKNLKIKINFKIMNKSFSSENLSISWDGSDFAFNNPCPNILESRKVCVLSILLDPSSLSVDYNALGFLNFNTQNYLIEATIAEANLRKTLNVADLDFGNIEARREAFKRIIISNQGDDYPLVIDQSQLSSNFEIVDNYCPATLLSRKSCVLNLKAKSEDEGSKSGKLIVSGVESNLSANFVPYNPLLNIIPNQNHIDFGETSVGEDLNFSILYFNKSFSDVNPISFDLPPFVEVVNSSCGSSLRSRIKCRVDFKIDKDNINESINEIIKLKESDRKESLAVTVSLSLQKPSITINAPSYSVQINPEVQIISDFATEIKISDSSDCSDGIWEPISTSKNINLNQNNGINHKYFKVKRFSNESVCIHKEIIHDDIAPEITFSQEDLFHINSVASSEIYNYEYSIVDTNKNNSHIVEVYTDETCSSLSLSETSSIENKNVSLNIRDYRSIKIKVSDLAGNVSEKCSYGVTFGQIQNIAVSGNGLEEIDAIENKIFTVAAKDIYNNNLPNIDLKVSTKEEIEKEYNTGASGEISIEISSRPDYVGSGLQFLAINKDIDNFLEIKNIESNKSHFKNIKIVRRSCSELLKYDALTGDELYFVDLDGIGGQEAREVYCDMTNGGWMRLDDNLGYQVGKNCMSGAGVVDSEGTWNVSSQPQANVNTSKGACGITSLDDMLIEELKVEEASLNTNAQCSATNYPEPRIQIVKANDVADYVANASELSGYNFAASSGTPITVFSKSLSSGLSNGVYSFLEGKYKIHFASKSENRIDTSEPKHSNGNVSNKLMYTLADDIVKEESSILYRMITGWISHSSTMTLKNSAGTTIWTGGRSRNNGSFSTVDDYPVNLTNINKNSVFTLSSSASVWNNGHGNHASDTLFLNLKYITCINKPVSAKLWARTSANIYPKSCSHALARNPSLQNTGTSVLITIDPDGYDNGVAPFDVLCDMNTSGGGWTLFTRFDGNDQPLVSKHFGSDNFGTLNSAIDQYSLKISQFPSVSKMMAKSNGSSISWDVANPQNINIPVNGGYSVTLAGTGNDGCAPKTLSFNTSGCWSGRFAGPVVGMTSGGTLGVCANTGGWAQTSYFYGMGDVGGTCNPRGKWNTRASDAAYMPIQEWYFK